MSQARRSLNDRRVPTTVTLSRATVEALDALATRKGTSRSAVLEKLLSTWLVEPNEARHSSPEERVEAREVAIEPLNNVVASITKPETPEPKPSPTNQLLEVFSKAVTDAGKELHELRLADRAALEEIFASAESANPSNPMAPFKLWVVHYVRDAESPTPSDLLTNLYRYAAIR